MYLKTSLSKRGCIIDFSHIKISILKIPRKGFDIERYVKKLIERVRPLDNFLFF